jgi:C4-dicarboxylate-specific signal transduction histidine kinase
MSSAPGMAEGTGVAAVAAPEARARRRLPRVGGLLWEMRVRKKVLVLHTLFSLGLAAVLLVPLRPAITEVVEQAEMNEAKLVLSLALSRGDGLERGASLSGLNSVRPAADMQIRSGSAAELGLSAAAVAQARATPRAAVPAFLRGDVASAAAYVPGPGDETFMTATVRIPEARRAVLQLYVLTAVALLAVYGLVAAALELFVLPQHVYGPISRMLDADRAVQEGNKDEELIPEAVMPSDELGEIMRSRNQSILAIRRHEHALAEALAEVERIATDLKRKNHLLEAARRNLADADRLASLGMMSAGIAHELNTPLAVVKGLAEKLHADAQRRLSPAEAALMVRVVRRLERLGDSLLDFARVRPPESRPVNVRGIAEEAVTLVRLDRDVGEVEVVNRVDGDLVVECDGDRMVQVLVNLVRNSVDAVRSSSTEGARSRRVVIAAETAERESQQWVSISVSDNGPGIHPDVLARLFEPFVSTRLDAHGTGLGLAVAEGIVREHGGLLLARNNADGPGATFEIMLPAAAGPYAGPEPTEASGAAACTLDGA